KTNRAAPREGAQPPVRRQRQQSETRIGHEGARGQGQQNDRGTGEEPGPGEAESARGCDQTEVDDAEACVAPEPRIRTWVVKLMDGAHDAVELERPSPGALGQAPRRLVLDCPAQIERERRYGGNGGEGRAD